MKRLAIIFTTLFCLFNIGNLSLLSAEVTNRGEFGDCESEGQCVNNRICQMERGVLSPSGAECGSAQLGGVAPPDSISRMNLDTGRADGIGLIVFLSNLINLFAIIAGIWSMFNFVQAGYIYIIAQSDTSAHEKVKEKVTYTIVGLALIAGSYTIAGLVGLLFFGDAAFILRPQLYSILDQ